MTKTISVDTTGPSDYRYFYTNFELALTSVQNFRAGDVKSGAADLKLSRLGRPHKILIKGLFDINGVVRVSMSTYQLSVEISKAVRWADVEPVICKLFEDVYKIDHLRFTHESVANKQDRFEQEPGSQLQITLRERLKPLIKIFKR